jgi:hypothetical protein
LSSIRDSLVSAPIDRLLLIAVIVLTGWIAHVAVESGSSLYLRRFQIESADNLLEVHILRLCPPYGGSPS